jgi:D-glycero-D-manno-heptose 1,7-bisphosphate phosphatase
MSMAVGGKRRGLILDRDGVINYDIGHLYRIDECRFVEGIFDMTKAFAIRGFAVVIATNQSGIGRGLYSEADYNALMDWIGAEFGQHDIAVAATYHCPDHPTAGVGAFRRDNPRRKPGPGMILQAAIDLSLDLSRSWTIGDKPSDIAAGRAAGIGTLVLYDARAPRVERNQDFWIVPRLLDAAALLEAEGG